MDLDVIIHSANVVALAGGAWALLKVVVPVGLAVRDSLQGTAIALKSLTDSIKDHELRLRDLEWLGIERRARIQRAEKQD